MKIPQYLQEKLLRFARAHMKNHVNAKGKVAPDFIVMRNGKPYLNRWYLIPRNPFLNIYLHRFDQSDDDRALHDHPWLNMSILIRGFYIEHTDPSGRRGGIMRSQGFAYFRRAKSAHRVELFPAGWGMPDNVYPEGEPLYNNVITLFITGPRIRRWGFLCPQGWVDFEKYSARVGNTSVLDKGCNQ